MAIIVDTTRVGSSVVLGAAQGAANAGWFGDGRDGDLYVADGETMALDVALDEGQIVKQYKNGYIGTGSLLTAANRCNGMVLLFTGDLTIKGTISMDKKAPLANPMEAQCASEAHVNQLGIIGGDSGIAGIGKFAISNDGSSISSISPCKDGGTQGRGSVFGGGYGPGSGNDDYKGGDAEPRPPIGTEIPYPGGAGSALYGTGAGAGSEYKGGNGPGGSAAIYTYYSSGTGVAGNNGDAIGGGMMAIFVKGKVEIASTGELSADGGNGASGVANYKRGEGGSVGWIVGVSGGGAGAGGGIVAIVHTGDYSNIGSIHANGGKCGAAGKYGDTEAAAATDGSIGSVLITTLAELLAK